jgi:hypothetical protein
MKTLGIRIKGIVSGIYYQISCKVADQEDAKTESGNSHNQLFPD